MKSFLHAVFFTASFVLSSVSYCEGIIDDRPVVVFREDDIRASWRQPLLELGGLSPLQYAKSRRIPITWGVITRFASGWGLTWSELVDYVSNAGGELASHSVTHENQTTAQGYIDEILNSKIIIEAASGMPCRTFLQPGTWTDIAYLDDFQELHNAVGQAIRQTYSCSQAYLGSGWHIGDVFYRYGSSPDMSLDYPRTLEPSPALATLDIIANTPGVIFVLTCHGVQPSTGTNNLEIRANVFKAVVDRLADLRDQGLVRLMSLSDAFALAFSSGLNRVPDPGFEIATPGRNNPVGPIVSLSQGVEMVRFEGRGGSRCAGIRKTGDFFTLSCRLDPGRYIVSWWQKRLGATESNWTSGISTASTQYQFRRAFEITQSEQVAQNDWVQKSALIVVPYGFPIAYWTFKNRSDTILYLDDISINESPLNPHISPSNSNASITPNAVTISWNTPANSNATSIVLRSSTSAFPSHPTEGDSVTSIPAQPGQRQEVTAQGIDWQSSSQFYFSIFALNESGAFTPPELLPVWVDETPPSVTALGVRWDDDGCLTASWNASDTESGVFACQYSVGSRPGADDHCQWTNTCDSSVKLSNLPQQFYVNVKAENLFGYWSNPTSVYSYQVDNISPALARPDETLVRVNGLVTGKFDGFYYLCSAARNRGIRVQGTTSASEGDTVAITGTLKTTADGERFLLPSQ